MCTHILSITVEYKIKWINYLTLQRVVLLEHTVRVRARVFVCVRALTPELVCICVGVFALVCVRACMLFAGIVFFNGCV